MGNYQNEWVNTPPRIQRNLPRRPSLERQSGFEQMEENFVENKISDNSILDQVNYESAKQIDDEYYYDDELRQDSFDEYQEDFIPEKENLIGQNQTMVNSSINQYQKTLPEIPENNLFFTNVQTNKPPRILPQPLGQRNQNEIRKNLDWKADDQKQIQNQNQNNIAVSKEESLPQNSFIKNGSLPQNSFFKNESLPQNSFIKNGSLPQNSFFKNENLPQNSFTKNENLPQNSFIKNENLPQNSFIKNESLPQNSFIKNESLPQNSFFKNEVLPQNNYFKNDDLSQNSFNKKEQWKNASVSEASIWQTVSSNDSHYEDSVQTQNKSEKPSPPYFTPRSSLDQNDTKPRRDSLDRQSTDETIPADEIHCKELGVPLITTTTTTTISLPPSAIKSENKTSSEPKTVKFSDDVHEKSPPALSGPINENIGFMPNDVSTSNNSSERPEILSKARVRWIAAFNKITSDFSEVRINYSF